MSEESCYIKVEGRWEYHSGLSDTDRGTLAINPRSSRQKSELVDQPQTISKVFLAVYVGPKIMW